MFLVQCLKKMAASFLTDRNSNRKQISHNKGCNLRQVKNTSFKEGRYNNTRKNGEIFHKKSKKVKTRRTNQINTKGNTRTESCSSAANGPLEAKNLLEDLSTFSLRSESKNSSCNTMKKNEQKYVKSGVYLCNVFPNFFII